jgi:hypothetical protein
VPDSENRIGRAAERIQESAMADYTNNNNNDRGDRSNKFLYFIVGGLVAVVAIGFFVVQGGSIGPAEVPTKQSAPASAPAEPAPAPATTPPAGSTSN